MADDVARISFLLPANLRAKIQSRAAAEERTESGFLRYHLARILEASEQEALDAEHCEELETASQP